MNAKIGEDLVCNVVDINYDSYSNFVSNTEKQNRKISGTTQFKLTNYTVYIIVKYDKILMLTYATTELHLTTGRP